MKKKIYIAAIPLENGDYYGIAVIKDGKYLKEISHHWCSNDSGVQRDMGLFDKDGTNSHFEDYKKYCGNDFELKGIGVPKSGEELEYHLDCKFATEVDLRLDDLEERIKKLEGKK